METSGLRYDGTAARAALLERFGYLSDVTFLDFEPELTGLYAAADIVVSMAGYNTYVSCCRAAVPTKNSIWAARHVSASSR